MFPNIPSECFENIDELFSRTTTKQGIPPIGHPLKSKAWAVGLPFSAGEAGAALTGVFPSRIAGPKWNLTQDDFINF